ncbi:sulfotransferase domain-containing protein [Pyxidicoccus fallax]|uniref:Sulfotransferase domain-containing protein n=1 Tax=Pyxidicoccus fallax TaxID=394095 RepID=A0A848LBB3_9BACT|nr:sulfotransferase domain-containing protein [Pyxidicoccus fallax]NMO13601.1 sulfotransferase domain-containing protein [Pyxidicoccus fallax]NPC77745.1 sulfotransferase domain-containing protein [Pyxidicoccus fallax]
MADRFSKWGRKMLDPLHWRMEFRPRPGDIFIATYPKSGTTWVQMILVQLLNEGRGEFDHILQVSPYLEELLMRNRIRHLESLPSPRLMKTHMLYEHLRPAKDSRIILVTRDVRDSIISFYYHNEMASRFRLDFNAFVERALRSRDNNWFTYMRSWLPHRHDDNVLWVRYEDLRENLEAQVRRIAAFCGIPLQEERMGDILHKCSFAYMKERETKFDFRLSMYEPLEGSFIRKGGSGGSERQRIREEHAAELARQLEQLRAELRLEDSERI